MEIKNRNLHIENNVYRFYDEGTKAQAFISKNEKEIFLVDSPNEIRYRISQLKSKNPHIPKLDFLGYLDEKFLVYRMPFYEYVDELSVAYKDYSRIVRYTHKNYMEVDFNHFDIFLTDMAIEIGGILGEALFELAEISEGISVAGDFMNFNFSQQNEFLILRDVITEYGV